MRTNFGRDGRVRYDDRYVARNVPFENEMQSRRKSQAKTRRERHDRRTTLVSTVDEVDVHTVAYIIIAFLLCNDFYRRLLSRATRTRVDKINDQARTKWFADNGDIYNNNIFCIFL